MWRAMRWECGGQTILFGDTRKSLFFTDFGAFNPAMTTGVFDSRTAYGMDGAIVYGSTLSVMQPRIEAVLLAFNASSRYVPLEKVVDFYTKKLCDAFHPGRTGRLYYKNHNGEWFIEARAQSFPAFGQYSGGALPFAVDLMAERPYWESAVENSVNIGMSSSGIILPVSAPFTTGDVVSRETFVLNPTPYDCYPVIRFWPGNICPVLSNSKTGKFITLNHEISEGFYVDVDTSPQRNTVTLYRLNESNHQYEPVVNTTHWLSADSQCDFYIVPGQNRIVANRISANADPAVTLFWRERSPGV